MRVVLASRNAHKLQELQTMLRRYDLELVLQSQLGIDIEPEENGSSFEENSYIKAKAIMEAANMPALADDSGLSVDALDGAPGIYSARYGGDACRSDKDRVALLLKNMQDVPEGRRTARFVCVLTLLYPDGRKTVAKGFCEGKIAREPSGISGFGYDPVFYVEDKGCTFAVMGAEQKNAISHRANALKLLCEMLDKEKENADR